MKNTKFSILVGYEIQVRLMELLKILHGASIESVMNYFLEKKIWRIYYKMLKFDKVGS